MKIVRFKELKKRVGYSRTHVDRLEAAGKFPKRIFLGPASVGWIDSEIDAWIAERVVARDAALAE